MNPQESTVNATRQSHKLSKWRQCALGIALSIAAVGSLQAASFKCKDARTAVEQLICSTPELSGLDSTLAEAYRGQASGASRQLQRRWIAEVRDQCSDAACLAHAYKVRIADLQGAKAGFDCKKASSSVENLICESNMLRYADGELNRAFQNVIQTGIDTKTHLAEQRQWVQSERDVCSTEQCLQSAYGQRTKQLEDQYNGHIETVKTKLGYSKQNDFSDIQLWPGEKNRIIALFAAQPETSNPSTGDGDFDVDIYIVDRTSLKVISHTVSSAASDAIALRGIRISPTNYSTVLGVPSFGVNLGHSHIGCASYEGSSMELYAEVNRKLTKVLAPITVSGSASMCGNVEENSGCLEGNSSDRHLEFGASKGKGLPDITVRATRLDEDGTFDTAKKTCTSVKTQKTYLLHFDGAAYKVPEGLDY